MPHLYSAAQAALHVRDRIDAHRVLKIETASVADVRRFGQDEQLRLDINEKTAKELSSELEANQKVLAALMKQKAMLKKNLAEIS